MASVAEASAMAMAASAAAAEASAAAAEASAAATTAAAEATTAAAAASSAALEATTAAAAAASAASEATTAASAAASAASAAVVAASAAAVALSAAAEATTAADAAAPAAAEATTEAADVSAVASLEECTATTAVESSTAAAEASAGASGASSAAAWEECAAATAVESAAVESAAAEAEASVAASGASAAVKKLRLTVFPVDLLIEVLELLPYKCLIRMLRVSKLWCSLIRQLLRRRSNSQLLLTTRAVEGTSTIHFSIFNLALIRMHQFSKTIVKGGPLSFSPIDSYGGLVCLGFQNGIVLLCNPSTEEITHLPETDGMETCLGFGYSTSTDVFKIFRFYSSFLQQCCEVFTVGTTDWRASISPPPFRVMHGRAPFLNGCLHLLPDADENGEYPNYIAVLDLDSELYRAPLLVPEEIFDDPHSTAHIALLGGLLTLCRSRDQPHSSIQIWVLNAYDVKTWVLRYTINASLLIDDPVSCLGFVADPLVLMPDGKILLNVWGKNQVHLLLYDSDSNKVVQRFETDSAAVLYTERFFSLMAGDVSQVSNL